MNDAEVRQLLQKILDEEAEEPVNWVRVQDLCNEFLRRISFASDYEPPHLIFHFLDDADVREKDGKYGELQRAGIRRFVETGDRAILESRSVSPWTCLLLVGFVAALAAWGVL